MCSVAEWEYLMRRIEAAVDERKVSGFVSDAGARIDALIDEIMSRCAPETAEWVRESDRRSRPEWII